MFTEVDSTKTLDRYYTIWRIVGFHYKKPNNFNRIFFIFLTIFITICHPLHLIIGLFQLTSLKDIFKNSIMNIACSICSLKHILYYLQFGRMKRISHLLKELDEHVITKEDREYHQQYMNLRTGLMLNVYVIAFHFVGFSLFAVWCMMKQPALMLEGWFPFDWKASTWTHMAAVGYQMLGMEIQVVQNILNDVYVPISLCLLSGHTRLLGNRLARIGYDESKSEKEHYADLVQCAEDYQRLTSLFYQIQETISWNMVMQSVTIGVNFFVTAFFVLFYAENAFESGYAVIVLIAIILEFYPGCYYGNVVEKNFDDLTYAMFSCNWMDRNPAFKRSLRILTEFTLRPSTMYAKGIIKVHVDTFVSTMRLSYSLFCLVLNMK